MLKSLLSNYHEEKIVKMLWKMKAVDAILRVSDIFKAIQIYSVLANYGLSIALCVHKFRGHVLNMKRENEKMALQVDCNRQCGIAKSN